MNSSQIQFPDGSTHKSNWVKNSEDAQNLLAQFYGQDHHVLCLCAEVPLRMAIKKRNQYYLAAYPNTKTLHHPDCVHYGEPPDTLSAAQRLTQDAKREVHGRIYISCDVSLTRREQSDEDEEPEQLSLPDDNEDKKKSKVGRKISLLSVLLDFWHGAQLNQWTASFAGKRYWGTVRNRLMEYTVNMYLNRIPLAKALYIPERFTKEDAEAIQQRRESFFSSWRGQDKRDFIIIGELRDIEPGEFGYVLKIKHDSTPCYMNEELYESFSMRYKHALSVYADNQSQDTKHERVIAIMTCNIPSKYITIRNITLMAVTEEYIPFHSDYELRLLKELVENKRTFMKPSKINLADHMVPDCVLLDTNKETVLAIFDDNEKPYDDYVANKEIALENIEYPVWKWYTHEGDTIPKLPEPASDD